MGGTGGRRAGRRARLIGALTAAVPALIRNLALEVAPIRVNLIAAGFVDTALSAGCSATSWTRAAKSCAATCRSAAWSARRTSPRWPST